MADGALNGIKILDLMWVIAGPSATPVLRILPSRRALSRKVQTSSSSRCSCRTLCSW